METSQRKILVNLLPPDVVLMQKEAGKLSLVNKFSIGALLLLVFMTAGTFAIRLVQGSDINQTNQSVVLAESRIADLKDREGYAVVLKNRLNSIENLTTDTRKVNAFNSIVSVAPADAQIALLSLDKDGVLVMTVSSASLNALESMLRNLGEASKGNGLISKVELENLSKGRDGIYRYSLRVYPK